jgi:hypothetical protein
MTRVGRLTALNFVTSGLPINLEYTPSAQYVVSSRLGEQ